MKCAVWVQIRVEAEQEGIAMDKSDDGASAEDLFKIRKASRIGTMKYDFRSNRTKVSRKRQCEFDFAQRRGRQSPRTAIEWMPVYADKPSIVFSTLAIARNCAPAEGRLNLGTSTLKEEYSNGCKRIHYGC